ncbi:MAG: hypothetical protein K0B07_04640 [DPANN group archaeon]|nr:hypothetical protein [DPANN group archaeon]
MGGKPVFNSLLRLFGKSVVEPAIDDDLDGVSSQTLPDISSSDSEVNDTVKDVAERVKLRITEDNRKRINEYWDFWDSNVFEMQNTNSNLLTGGLLSYDNFFVDLYFRDLMNDGFKKRNIAVFDVDNTLFQDGNLTFNPHNSNMIGLMDVGVKQGIFNSPYEIFSDYMDMSDISLNGKSIISLEGIYDYEKLSKMDLHLSRGFAEIYNLHKVDGGKAFFEAKLHFLKEMCAHPEKTCMTQTYFQDLMLLRKCYDTVAFLTLSDNDIAKVIFEISDLVMSGSDYGKVMSIGSTLSVGARKIDIDDNNSLNRYVNLAFGPKKINLLNRYFREFGVSEKIRTISTISDILSSDPTAFSLKDMVDIENVCGLDYPHAVIAYDVKPEQVIFKLTSDNIEDFSGLKEFDSKGNVKRVICNFVGNSKNDEWSEVIEKYAFTNGIYFNKIKKATDVVTLELFEQSIKTMLFDYGFDGIKYICNELEGVKPIIEKYMLNFSEDILEDIRDRFELMRNTLIDDYPTIKSGNDCEEDVTLFLKLLSMEINDIDKKYGLKRPGSRLKTSCLFNIDERTIEKIEKSLQDKEKAYSKPMYEFADLSYVPKLQVSPVSDTFSGIFQKNNTALLGEVVRLFANHEKSYSFLAKTYCCEPDTLSVLKDVTCRNEMFLRLMN